MSTTKRTRIPNKPILSSTVTKVVSGKVVKTGKATTPQRAKPKKLVSGEQREVSAIHPVHKSDKKDNRKLFSESETDSEILHSPRNSNQNSFSSTHSNQSTPKRDSLESLKKQINELSKYSFQQSQLIKKLHADLVRAELVTGNSDTNILTSLTPDQFSFIGQRFHYLIDIYISQNERLKKIGGIDQAEKQFNDQNDRALQADEICKKELGEDYTTDQLSELLDQHRIRSRDINFDSNAELGQKVRNIFDEGSENDSIVSHIESLNFLAESMKKVTKVQDNDINTLINYLKNKIKESDRLKARNEELQKDNDNLDHLLRESQEKLQQYSINNEDQKILNSLRKFYQEGQNVNQLVERDLELSNSVRNIFNEDDNNDAILRTIQSNKESADDNTKVAELSSKLQQLQRNESETIEKLNNQHQQELAEKDSLIIQLKQENSYLRGQHQNHAETIENNKQKIADNENQISRLQQENNELRNQASSIQNLNETVSSHQKALAEKDNQISKLQQENNELRNQANSVQSLTSTLESDQQKLAEKDNLISRLQQENDELRNQANSVQSLNETVSNHQQALNEKDNQISRLQQENDDLRNQVNSVQSLNETISNHQQALNEKDNQISRLQQENNELRNQANSVQGLNETISNHQQRLSEKEALINNLTQENNYLKTEAQKHEYTIHNINDLLENNQRELAEKESQIVELTRLIDDLKAQSGSQSEAEQILLQRYQQEAEAKESQILQLRQENNYLKDQQQNQTNSIQSLRVTAENNQQKLAEKDDRINQLNQENEYLRNQGQSQAISIREMTSKIDTIQKQVNQKQDELNDAYRRLEQEGKENEEQRKDRELSTKVREVFNSCPEDSIVKFIKKDVELASSIRYIYKSGDDHYIINKIKGEHHENELVLAENSNLTKENSQLRNDISEKNKINEQREKENDELRKVMNNIDDVRNKEIEYLKRELLTSLDKQKELENQMLYKNVETDQLRNEINQRVNSIEQKEKEINLIKQSKEDQIKKLKQEIKDKENDTVQLRTQISEHLNVIEQKDKEIDQIKQSKEKKHQEDNLFESVTNLFHPDLSEEDIKNHSQKIAQTAEKFYNDSDAKPALDSLFEAASGENLHALVEQMKNDPDESVRKNAEILSDVLKDSRMSVEAEGMITATLAMFLQQIANDQPRQQ